MFKNYYEKLCWLWAEWDEGEEEGEEEGGWGYWGD